MRHRDIINVWKTMLDVFAERMITFKKIVMYNRRLALRRIRKRQIQLRLQYIQRFIDIQNQFLLQIPRPIEKRIRKGSDNSEPWNIRSLDDTDYLESFRISKETFNLICNIVRDDLTPRVSSVRNPIQLERRVAICLYKLTNGSEYRKVSERFGVARSTVCKFLKTFCESLINRARDAVIKMPSDELEIMENTGKFEELCNLPVFGVLDLVHIPINASTSGFKDCLNDNEISSIILQAVVDHQLLFRKIDTESRDATSFANNIDNIPKVDRKIDKNKSVSCHLVGSSLYPLYPSLMKNYLNPSNDEQKIFNECISKALKMSDDAFCRLFARFKVLSKKVDIEYRTMKIIVPACCILHNVIERNKDEFNNEWLCDSNTMSTHIQLKEKMKINNIESEDGKEIRKLLTSYLKNQVK